MPNFLKSLPPRTNRQEGVETFELGGGQSLIITLEEIVKPVVGAQGPFERGDSLGEVVVGDRVRLSGERLLEAGDVLLLGLQLLDHRGLARHAHLTRIENRTLGLVFQTLGATIPELGDMEAGVEHRR
jgi:hypothetical protein